MNVSAPTSGGSAAWRLLCTLAVMTLLPVATAQENGDVVGTATSNGKEIPIIYNDGTSEASCSAGIPEGVWVAGSLSLGGAALGLAWIKWLRWSPLLGGFTRLRQDRLLDHPVRARLHQAVEQSPGLHFQGLCAQLDKPNGQVAHHLAALVRGGLMDQVRGRGYATYFLKGTVDASVMNAMQAAKSATAVAVLQAAAHEPGHGHRDLARRIGRPESTIRHHHRRLCDAGLLDDGGAVTATGHQVLRIIHPERPERPPGTFSA